MWVRRLPWLDVSILIWVLASTPSGVVVGRESDSTKWKTNKGER